jgi:NADH:ubiquinone oxidoreductase subunit 4 (subunit M)
MTESIALFAAALVILAVGVYPSPLLGLIDAILR